MSMFGASSPINQRPIIPVMQAMGVQPQKPADILPQRRGLFGGLRQWLTPERLAILGAGLRQAGGVDGSLDQVLQRQMEAARQQTEDAVRQRAMDRQTIQDKQGDAQQQAVDAWVQTLPPEQQRAAQLNPQAAVQAYTQQAFPAAPEWRPGYGHAYRINPDGTTDVGGAIPEAPRYSGGGGLGGGGTSGPLGAEDVQFYGQQYLRTGRLPTGMSVRSPEARQILNAVPRMARDADVTPEQLALRESAYSGDRGSYQTLLRQRDSIVAFERTADAFLDNVEQRLRAVPPNQITNIPTANDALQSYYRTLGSSGPLSAYVGAIISARADLARVISGQNNPPVEAMHEAERLLPSNIAPSAFATVRENLRREMSLKSSAFDNTLADIRHRQETGDVPSFDDGGDATPPSTLGGVLRRSIRQGLSGNSPRVRTYNPSTGRLE